MAVFFARTFLGVLFTFQGYDAVFGVRVSGVLSEIRQPLLERGFPDGLIRFGAFYTSWVQLVAGFCLIIGFAKYYALYLLGIDLLIAAVAFGAVKPMWDMQHVFPRLILLLIVLIIPSEWDVLSIDYVWSIIKFVKSLT